MENPKKEIVICLGSSCFARGNKQLVKFISDYLRDRNLLNDVKFHGERCFGHCFKGLVFKIEHEIHEKIDEEKILGLLDDFFLSIIQQDNYR
ncbi:MAG: NAD(P)H-dependent oxidoreductase subunit E [Bacteroidales bacterium]|nr:NAD(P)H-dependent oxidoreductase subunit E [Bacteroidales bacterium]